MSANKKHRTHWQWYKNFFNITILRYLVTWFSIVPFIVKLIQSVKTPLIIQTTNESFIELNLSLPFSWQFLWISSLAFVIALLIYQIACPSFIKTYNSYGDYKQHMHSPRWIIWETFKVLEDENEIDKLFERLNEKKYLKKIEKKLDKNEVIVEEKQTTAYFSYKNANYSLSLPILKNNGEVSTSKTKIAESEIFWEIFGRFSSSKKFIRNLIIFLLFISGAFFSIVFVQNIISGIKYFI